MQPSDISDAQWTRVRCIYDLKPRLRYESLTSLAEVFDYGRFRGHVEASDTLLPKVLHTAPLPPASLQLTSAWPGRDHVREATAVVLVTPRGDPLLQLDLELAGEPTSAQVTSLVAVTCFDRQEITVRDEPIEEWLSGELGLESPIAFGRHVHQCVFLGGDLRDQLLKAAAEDSVPAIATMIIYRGTVSPDRGATLGIRTPGALNNPGETFVGHGRGVSLIVGWGPHVENALSLAAATMVTAMGVLHRVRDLAFDALELDQSAALASTDDGRNLVSRLSMQLNAVQLDLSFGVEAYVDSVLVPELLVDRFQISMREATGLDIGLSNTSRMVDRLASVIHARGAALEAATYDEDQRRSRVVSVMLGVGSLLALPPALLLAFFGTRGPDIDPARSILEVGQYWGAYALAWLPFVALLAVGLLIRRRIRSRPRLAGFGDAPGDPVGRALAVVPRARVTSGATAFGE